MRRMIVALAVAAFCAPAVVPRAAAADSATYSEREQKLKMPEIIEALGLKSGSAVADIGAGEGEYEAALSRAAGAKGRIYAEDITAGAVKELKKTISSKRLKNTTVVLGVAEDPRLPAGSLDAALMVIAYHEVVPYQKMLEHLLAALKPGGRLVVVDMMPHKTISRPRSEQTKNHVIAADLAEAEIRAAGFEVVSRNDQFIDRPDEESTRWMIVFRKPGGGM